MAIKNFQNNGNKEFSKQSFWQDKIFKITAIKNFQNNGNKELSKQIFWQDKIFKIMVIKNFQKKFFCLKIVIKREIL